MTCSISGEFDRDDRLSYEEALARRMDGVASTLPSPIYTPPIAKPSPSSSIEASESIRERPSLSRPKIEAPKENTIEAFRQYAGSQKNFGWKIVKLVEDGDRLSDLALQIVEAETTADAERYQKLKEESNKAIDEQLKLEKTEKKWSVLQSAFQYFVSAASIVFGAALVATGVGVVAGSLLIAGGALGLINQVMTEAGAWRSLVSYFTDSQQLRDRISNQIQLGMFFVSLALSLTGGAFALQAGAVTQIASLDRAIKALTLGTTVASAAAELGKSITKKRSLDVQKKIDLLKSETTDLSYKMSRDLLSEQERSRVKQENDTTSKRSLQNLEVGS